MGGEEAAIHKEGSAGSVGGCAVRSFSVLGVGLYELNRSVCIPSVVVLLLGIREVAMRAAVRTVGEVALLLRVSFLYKFLITAALVTAYGYVSVFVTVRIIVYPAAAIRSGSFSQSGLGITSLVQAP